MQSHLPERAETRGAAIGDAAAWPLPDDARPRPIVLLSRPEELDNVTAPIPDGPPSFFRWRGARHDVMRAQGPERISGEWWRSRKYQLSRDYYIVEDKSGRRFWVYREGLYEHEITHPRWFMQGLFA